MHDCVILSPSHIPGPPTLEASLRPSVPEDLEAITRIHMEGFAGYRSTLLGRGVVRRLNQWFIVQSESICFTALADGNVCGYVVGAPAGFTQALTRYTFLHAAAALLCRPCLWLRPAILKGIVVKVLQVLGIGFGAPRPTRTEEPPPGRDFALVGIGVDSRRRGLGIAGLLMKAFEGEAARRGFPRTSLSVKRGNLSALKAYEKSGWRIVHEDPFNDLFVYEKRLS